MLDYRGKTENWKYKLHWNNFELCHELFFSVKESNYALKVHRIHCFQNWQHPLIPNLWHVLVGTTLWRRIGCVISLHIFMCCRLLVSFALCWTGLHGVNVCCFGNFHSLFFNILGWIMFPVYVVHIYIYTYSIIFHIYIYIYSINIHIFHK